MRRFTRLAVLSTMGGLISCGGLASKSIPDAAIEIVPVKLLSAERNNAGWMPNGTNGEDGRRQYRTVHSSWTASPNALIRLENALLNNPWVSITEYSLTGGKRQSGRASQVRNWIDCAFSNGRKLRIFFNKGDSARIVDGWYGNRGRYGYRLDISIVECQEILEITDWVNEKDWTTVGEPLPENDKSLSLLQVHPGAIFSSSLAHNPEANPPSVLVATRAIPQSRGAEGGDTAGGQVVAHARGETLSQLENVVQGRRWSTLKFTIDGEVHPLERDEPPIEKINCQMSDGQTIDIHVFPSDGAWCVIGEGSFRLALSENDAFELLELAGWEVKD